MHVSDPLLMPVRAALLACASLFPIHAAHALQAADYQRAERVHDSHLRGALRNASVLPQWLADGRFWYEREDTQGRRQAILVDPIQATRQILFEPDALDAAVAPLGASGPRLRLNNVQVLMMACACGSTARRRSTANGHACSARPHNRHCRRLMHCRRPAVMPGCRYATTTCGCSALERRRSY